MSKSVLASARWYSSIVYACKNISEHRGTAFLAVWLVAVAFLAFFFMSKTGLIGDEGAHFDQIQEIVRFLQHGTTVHYHHPAFPTYHFLLALASIATGIPSVPFLRFLTLCINLGVVAAFYRVARHIDPRTATWKAVLCFFFPLFFPFSFLIYIDIPSTLLVFISLEATLRGHERLASICAALAVLMRQTNIVWLLFDFVLLYVLHHGFTLRYDSVIAHLRRIWTFLLVIFFFGIFVSINGGVAIADRTSHPPFSFHWGNMYIALVGAFLLFLPVHITNTPRIVRMCRRYWLPCLLVLVLTLVFFLLTFANDHPYNHDLWWLRNRFLMFVLAQWWRKVALYGICAFTVLSLMVTKLRRRAFTLLYPFSALLLGGSWLIEPRYYLVPYLLFLLFLSKRTHHEELLMGCIVMTTSLILYYGMLHHLFLP